MVRGTWITVAIVLAVAVAVAAFGLRLARLDRAALVAAFSEEQTSRLRLAALETEKDLQASWRDLDFAARLVDSSGSASERTRELRALLAVEAAYHLVEIYDGAGRRELSVVDPLLPGDWSPAPFQEALGRTARRALASRAPVASGLLHGPGSPWYRVLATPRARPEGGAVTLLVDVRESFEELRVAVPDRSGLLVLLGPDGVPTPLTPRTLAEPGAFQSSPALAALVSALRAGQAGSTSLPARDAAALGLEGGDAMAAFTPIRDGPGGHWGAAVLDRGDVLRAQERVISLQTISLGATLAAAVTLLSAYLVLNARRASAVQLRLREAEQLAHLREQSEKILENVPVPVVALDGASRVSALNHAALRTVPESALGGPLEVAFPGAAPDTLAALRATIAEARTTGVVRTAGQPLALSGRETCFEVHAVPLEHPLPDVRLLVVLIDLTAQRALTAQLLRAEKLATVGVLAAGIAHEIGTPLAVVRGRAERISEKLGGGHPQARDGLTIVEEIDRISRTLRELLDYSRPSAPLAVPVSLEEVSRAVLELLALEARARGVTMRLDLPPRLPPLAADRDQLQQVLVNVALNALHACGRGGTVTLRGALRRDGALDIEVEDDGEGIPEELRARVFDPFFTTKKRGEGTGLGLTIVAQLVRGHGGDLDVDSAVGRGTRVRIGWPLAAATEARHG